MNAKQRAAEAALAHLRDGMVVGLGTGSTADFFLQALAAAIRDKRLRDIRGIPTSRQSERRATHLAIPLATFTECPRADVTVDGADEIDPRMNLIKGLGGALLREKIVAQNSDKLVIIADASKTVPKLGSRAPLPVEVAQFGHETQAAFLASLGCEAALRKTPDDAVYTTDNGNVIYDCRFADGIADPTDLEIQLGRRAGVVESGLFLNIASVVLVADENGVETRTR